MRSSKEIYEKSALVKIGNLREITMFDPGLQFSGMKDPQNGLGGGIVGGRTQLPETGLAVGAYALIGAAFVFIGSIIRKISKA